MQQRSVETSCRYDEDAKTLTLKMEGLPREYANVYMKGLHMAVEQITLMIPRADLTPTQWGETKDGRS